MLIGLDVGGTHTDVVLLSNEGVACTKKVPTDPSNLFESVVKGLDAVLADTDPSKIKRVVLSTTLSTNAVVQNKMPPVGMIVSSGPGIDPEFYRTSSHYHAVAGSIDHRGREIDPVRPYEILEVMDQFKKAGIDHIGIVGKFSVRNPAHELTIYELVKGSFESVFMGHRLSGALNFPRRIATTYLNAAVSPIHKEFYKAIEQSLKKAGLTTPIRILKADGGNMSFQSSTDFPVQTILSGPAASVVGAMVFADDQSEKLVLDIGGTTTDMSVLVHGAPLLNPLGISVGPYQTLIRSLETLSIGIGGDSHVSVIHGEIKIGPDRKGPAMAHGGPVPTPTDALFVLGKNIDGDRDKAVQGFTPIAEALGMSVEEAADKIFKRTCRMILLEARKMIRRINRKPVYTVYEMLEGHKVKPVEILVLGGPAPYFAECFNEVSDFKAKVVPRWTVANAIGAALARTTSEVMLFADTEQGIATSPGENFREEIPNTFTKEEAIVMALDLLRQKALRRGANPEYLEMEVVEEQEFNMVRGFYTTGKNIRVKVQVKPGLIHGYDNLIRKLKAE
ncbi:MAG: hydantoinase/oxoprolinase family protein [Proteobacteria bacterium]|nr:hydantoinase/oxoprolinase family protein [Pseudomonadota bacterium]MBU4471896.1 hydantoinase/oxoprolinase family protein [Pseudomonadota bacterium]MCG2752828.1 hydantoinase/oxoprolinase family protein [Desulfobacteraceae bacterium]